MFFISDDTPTEKIVLLAAQSIGKECEEGVINNITDYLATQNWYSSAADLRTAISSTEEWKSLNLPGRLKLALQQVLSKTCCDVETIDNTGIDQTDTTEKHEIDINEGNIESNLEQNFDTTSNEYLASEISETNDQSSWYDEYGNYRTYIYEENTHHENENIDQNQYDAEYVYENNESTIDAVETQKNYSENSYYEGFQAPDDVKSQDNIYGQTCGENNVYDRKEEVYYDEYTEPEWACSICSLLNITSATVCSACAAKKPGYEGDWFLTDDNEKVNSDIPTAQVILSHQDQYQSKDQVKNNVDYSQLAWNETEGEESKEFGTFWKCQMCGYEENGVIENYCVVCSEHISRSYDENSGKPIEYNSLNEYAPIPTAPLNIPTAPFPLPVDIKESESRYPVDYMYLRGNEKVGEIKPWANMAFNPIKYPCLRDSMFNYNAELHTKHVDLCEINHNAGDPEYVKRAIRLPWQSKYRQRKHRAKKLAKKLGEVFHIGHKKEKNVDHNSNEGDSSSSSASSSDESEDKASHDSDESDS